MKAKPNRTPEVQSKITARKATGPAQVSTPRQRFAAVRKIFQMKCAVQSPIAPWLAGCNKVLKTSTKTPRTIIVPRVVRKMDTHYRGLLNVWGCLSFDRTVRLHFYACTLKSLRWDRNC